MILKVFIFWRLCLFLLTYLGSLIFPKIANGGIGAIGPGKAFDFFASWAQWDGGHFINIARLGYFAPQEYAFFPLLPNLIRFASIFTFGNYVLAGLLVTNVFFFLFLFLFYKLVNKTFGQKIAKTAVVTFLAFPTAYFGVAVYSESVFLLFAVLTLYYLENKKLLLTVVASSFAGATRLIGAFLIIPVAWSYLESISFKIKRLNWKILFIPFSLSGLFLYSFYLFLKFGDPFYFSTVESVWHRSFVNPVATMFSYFTVNPFAKPFNDYLDITVTLGFLAILLIGFKKIPKSWWFYSLLVILLPASTGTLTSMPRYALSAFPVFILIAIYLENKTILKITVWGIFLIAQISLAILFVNGYWTA